MTIDLTDSLKLTTAIPLSKNRLRRRILVIVIVIVGATHAGASEEPELSNFTFLSSSSGDSYNYHRIEIPDNGTALYASIFPVNPVDIYYVYLKYEDFPNETYYDWVAVIPNPELSETDPKRYVFAPPQNYTSINGTYRIGIRLKGISTCC